MNTVFLCSVSCTSFSTQLYKNLLTWKASYKGNIKISLIFWTDFHIRCKAVTKQCFAYKLHRYTYILSGQHGPILVNGVLTTEIP
jgi:hypothetical protein